jgi:hypothetical protein
MKLPNLKLLVESLVDRDNLVKALQDGDKEAAMKAISSAMKNKKSYNTPAQEFDLDDSQYKQMVNLVRKGDMEKAASIIGVGGDYPQRGIGADIPPVGKPGEEIGKHLEVFKKIIYSGRPKDADFVTEYDQVGAIFYGIDKDKVMSGMSALSDPYRKSHPGTVDVDVINDPLVEQGEDAGLLTLWIPQGKNRVWHDVHIHLVGSEKGKEHEVETLFRKVFKEYA